MKKLNIKEECLGDVNYWETLFKNPEANFKKLKKQTKRDLLTLAYQKSPDNIRLNKDWVIKAVKEYQIHFYDVDSQIKDKEFCSRYIEEYQYPSIVGIPDQYQEELFEKTIVKCEWSVRDIFYNKNLKHLNNKENICKWVEQNPNIYKELEKTSYKNNFAIAEAAAKKDPNLLLKMNKTIARKIITRNLNIMLEFFIQGGRIFHLLPLKIRNNKEFVLQNINKINYENVSYIGKEVLTHKEILLKLRTFYQVVIPEELLTDKELVYHIIKEESYVRNQFKDCENFKVVDLIKKLLLEKKYAHFYKNLSNEYKSHPKVISAFLEIGYYEDFVDVRSTSFDFTSKQRQSISVIKLLEEKIQQELIEEYKELTNTVQQPEEKELLSFARNKYLKINLNEELKDKLKVKTSKI